MGYAKAGQTARGIHQRLRARAFIIAQIEKDEEEDMFTEQPPIEASSEERTRLMNWVRRSREHQQLFVSGVRESADPAKTVCFVSIDAGMGSDLLNIRVVKRLEELLPPQKQNEEEGGEKRLCHLENLSISGTHTHSAPAGFIQYALYQITSLGFSEEVMQAYVEGIAQALFRAYANLQPGSMQLAEGMLWNANINRSPSSYVLNSEAEREQYASEGNTDKRMLQLKISTLVDDKPLGLLNWFAVHGTSMNSSNTLISGDNKGYASYLAEKHFNGNETLPGKGDFVAAFASTNLGDVSPNIAGPRCIDTGSACDFTKSTCNGRAQLCVAFGPGKDMFESTEVIGRRQYEMAVRLFHSRNLTTIQGGVDFRHSFVDMSSLNVTLADGNVVRTCPAALGYSFAGGTTDGPGDFDFTQGRITSNPFWNMIGGFLSIPTKEQNECQFPKPILLNTGKANVPYDWDPNTVPISIFQIGQLYILNIPAELTTMAGRRLRKAVRDVLVAGGVKDPVITIAGLSNSYTVMNAFLGYPAFPSRVADRCSSAHCHSFLVSCIDSTM